MLWASLSAGGTRLVALLATAVLARLLGAEAFGLLAFALVVLAWAETIGDLGTGMALIWWPGRREDAAQVTFAINLVMAVFWCALLQALAPAAAAFLQRPEGGEVLQVLAWAFPLKFLGATHEALARKDLGFRRLLVPELAMALLKGGLAVILALWGWGVWSLVAGHLAGQAVATVILWAMVPWRPSLRWPRGVLGPLLGYGKGLVAVNVIAAVVHHVDVLFVGRMLGVAALGFYQMAGRIPDMTVTLLMRTVSRVIFPAFAAARSEGRSLSGPYRIALRWVGVLALPAGVGLLLLARPLVLGVFGPGWEPSVPVFQALAVYVVLRALGTHAGDVLKATGRTGLLAGLGVIKAVLVVGALWAGARHGIGAAAWALSLATAGTLALNWGVICRILGLGPGDLARALRPGVLGTAVMAGAVGGLLSLIPGPHGLPTAVGAALAGALVHFLVVAAVAPDIPETLVLLLAGDPAATRPLRIGRFHVPWHDAGILRWYLGHLHVRHRRRDRILARLLRLPLAGLWSRPFLAGRSVCRKGDDPRERRGDLLASAGLLKPAGGAAQARLCWIELPQAPEEGRGRGLKFLFPVGGASRRAEPQAVLKTSEGEGGLGREAHLLEHLHARLSPEMRRTLPRVLARRDAGAAGQALVLSVVPGVSFYGQVLASHAPEVLAQRHLPAAAWWLARFQRETRAATSALEAGALAEEVDRGIRSAGLEASTDDWSGRLARRLETEEVLATAVHGDFWPRNLLTAPDDLGEGRPAVVDWEAGRREGEPWRDLFFFAFAYLRLYLYRKGGAARSAKGRSQDLGRVLTEPSVPGRLLGGFFRCYAARADVPLEILPDLLRLELLRRAAAAARGAGSSSFSKEPFPNETWSTAYRMLARRSPYVFSG